MKKGSFLFVLCVFIGILSNIQPFGLSLSQDRSIRQIVIKTHDNQSIILYRKSYALVVGVSSYTQGWSNLTNAENDAKEVKVALEKQGFRVKLLPNPTSTQLKIVLNQFNSETGVDPESRVLFYFAGHGHSLPMSWGDSIGYIVPSDAPLPDVDKAGFQQKAISMEMFNTFAREIDAKHALFIFDCCFSGSIFDMRGGTPEDISYNTSKPVRQFITAGSSDEYVPDKSIFKDEFLSALNGEADANNDGYTTGTELGMFLQKKVINYTRGAQHPQYGKIKDGKLDKGDFVFNLGSKLAITPKVSIPPKTSGLDVSSYQAEARLAESKRQWDDWQARMWIDFQKASSLDVDNNLTTSSKVQLWNDFLKSYDGDNPYSSEDETLRDRASECIVLWLAYLTPIERSAYLKNPDFAGFFSLDITTINYADTIAKHYKEGLRSFVSRVYPNALQHFEIALSNCTDNTRLGNSQYWIGECYNQLGNYEQAIIAFDKVGSFVNSYHNEDALFMSGICYLKLGDRYNAKVKFQKLVEVYPSSKQVKKALRYLASL